MAEPPTPRRIVRPRWLNIRIVGGVVLLIAAVIVGTKVIGSASQTSPVWAATRDFAAGTVVQPGDFVAAEVNLGEYGQRYLDSASALTGRVLTSPIRAGELLPAAALQQPGGGRVMSIPVTPDHMAPGVDHGSVIDLYLVIDPKGLASGAPTTRLLRQGVTVQSVTAPASGGLSGAVSNKYRVALLVSAEQSADLVRQLPLGEAVVVRHSDDDRG